MVESELDAEILSRFANRLHRERGARTPYQVFSANGLVSMPSIARIVGESRPDASVVAVVDRDSDSLLRHRLKDDAVEASAVEVLVIDPDMTSWIPWSAREGSRWRRLGDHAALIDSIDLDTLITSNPSFAHLANYLGAREPRPG